MKTRSSLVLVWLYALALAAGATNACAYEYAGHTYFLTSAGTWAEAEAEAVSHGGHLVSINDAAEQVFINGLLAGSTWIGFTDEASSWHWVNSDPVTYTNWSPAEPNGGASENCGVAEEAWGGLWNDLPCDRVLRGVAELEPDWALVDLFSGLERSSMAMAYDSDRGVVVLFGGRSGSVFSDTWEFDGTVWTRIETSNTPPARFWHSMVYDSNRHRMVLYGGSDRDLSILYSDTWEFDGTDWHEVVTAHSPGPRDQMSMAFDSYANRVVLFGGQSFWSEQNDTWEYDGTDWLQVFTASSPPRGTLAAMAFDTVRKRVVFFGSGVVFDPGPSDSSTWEFDGADWTEISTLTMPPGRWAHSMAYDSTHQRVILFGGYSVSYPSGTQTNETWAYDGSDWTQIMTDTVPSAREQHGMAYDAARNRIVMFGGWSATGSDTWELIDEVSPDELVGNALNFISYAIEEGTLEGGGTGASADGRLGAVVNMIETAGSLIDDGLTGLACDQLQDAARRTDGLSPPKDFVTGTDAMELLRLIEDIRDSLDC